jgi:ABC-2 type transport system ATP-binding protein
MIVSEALSKKFEDFTAVAPASFRVGQGTVGALLGPNGAGKSTLVKMLTGLLEPTSGSAVVGGLQAGDPGFRRMIGVLPENLAVFDALTIGEHLELTSSVYGVGGREGRSRAGQLLRLLGLQEAKDTFVSECSYGMKKKTALAMALLPNPKVLFLDEPFEGLDPVTAQSLRLLLRAIVRKGVTVFLTSHILSLVDRVADRVLLIRQGVIVLDEEIAKMPASLEEVYFGLVEKAPEGSALEWLGST